MTELHKSKGIAWCLLAGFCVVWFYALGARTLVPTDEGRYAEIAREMATTGDFITPRLNGIKYFGKPPLQAWMNALTFRAFGLGEWQARLWTGLCGLFGIVLASYAGIRVFNERVGFTAGIVLASTLFWAAAGHINSYDMGLAAMMTLALGALLIAQRNDASARERRNWMLVCWAAMALAVLSKGLIGVLLPGAVLVLYTLASRDWALWKRLHLGPGLLVFFAVTAPWFVLVSLNNPEFPHFFFIREHIQRFTSNVHGRAQPWHYFIPFLILGALPWLGVLAQSLWNARRDAPAGFQPKKLLLVWVAFIFFFFSMSGAKLPSYILPIFPALALLIACYLESASYKAIVVAAALLGLGSAVGLALVPKIPTLAGNVYELPLYHAYMPWITAATVLGLAGGLIAASLAQRQREWALVTLAATGFLSGQAIMIGHEPLGRYKAGIAHVPAIQAELTPQTPVYAVGGYEYLLPFYLGRTLILVENAADGMELGLKQEPRLWLPKIDAFIATWTADHARGKKAIAILRPDIFIALQKMAVPMRIIAQDPHRVIVTNDVNHRPGA